MLLPKFMASHVRQQGPSELETSGSCLSALVPLPVVLAEFPSINMADHCYGFHHVQPSLSNALLSDAQ